MRERRERRRSAAAEAGGPDGEPEVRSRLSAFDRAARLLERRPHFRREIEQKLARAGHEIDEIDEAVQRLTRLGYLDDLPAARSFAAQLAERKGYGVKRIRSELARRGADEEAIAGALAALPADGDFDRAREAAGRWQRRGGDAPAALARHLDRRGFDRRVIFAVLKELAPAAGGESFADE
ncbi:MAG: regulatory protein RecX [Thermoanaerobaculia bacterium]